MEEKHFGDASDSTVKEVSGIRLMLDKFVQHYDRLPMLEVAFEKFIQQLSNSLRNLISEVVEVKVNELSSTRFMQYFQNYDAHYTLAVFKAVEWNNSYGLLVLDYLTVVSFVDLLLGGKKSYNKTKINIKNSKKKLTSIERCVARQLSEVFLVALGQSFDQIVPTSFIFEKLEDNPIFLNIARSDDATMVIELKITIYEKSLPFAVMIPYKTIEPVKPQMQEVFLGEKYGTLQEWSGVLRKLVSDVEINLDTVISSEFRLSDIMQIQVGDTLVTSHHKDRDMVMYSDDTGLLLGKIGKIGNKMGFKVKNAVQVSS
ncbi:FliM/FliN family flagellar motor switch protein [Rickettsia endosymbiont of Cardiosporidium cionae]|uniref:FliM/FliN family flagellar motor switch protein n=1 Tax=Rickettsia endosymbiont of Cardiosporidium cionae TaxID=2777155 RepID=UPI0018948636|nr:FliM/FliN family flagellar motor switch protein [Rickettsia endosymbiont of Cardiosporidium cionae]KAF8818596.1 hypothetical protein IHI24_000315 [Rickettsia endosymbiont of Cardiosporidium cionae]